MAVVMCPSCGQKNRVDEAVAGSVAVKAVCGRCKAELPAGQEADAPHHTRGAGGGAEPVVLTDATFDGFMRDAGDRPVLVDAWAPWCGPCRMLAPAIDELAAESGGKYRVAKLNTDENPRTAARFGVNALPTVLILKRGQLVDQLVGLQPKQVIAHRINAHV